MHLSRGAKTAPDLNIHGRQTGGGWETKVSLPPGSDTPGGKSPNILCNYGRARLGFLPSAASSVPPGDEIHGGAAGGGSEGGRNLGEGDGGEANQRVGVERRAWKGKRLASPYQFKHFPLGFLASPRLTGLPG